MKTRFLAPLALFAIVAAELAATHAARAQEEELAARHELVTRLERTPPRAPEQSIKAMQVLPGFRVELVASEPLLRSPIAIDFDEDGRMYAVEYAEYNAYAATRPHGHGAIRRLEDRDGDGRYDHSTPFAENVPWASGVCCYDGGVYVTATPDLLYLKDTDGDGKADIRERVLTGFARDPSGEALANGLHWGLDHRIHLSASSAGGLIRRADRPDDKPVSARNLGVALDPRTREWALTGGGGEYGVAFDDWGRKLVCEASNPIQQVMYDSRYVARNPAVLAPFGSLSITPDGKYTQLFRISPIERWRIAREQMRQRQLGGGSREQGIVSNIFTSGTGITVYRGDAFPAAYQGNVFVGEVANNLVYQARLEPNGVPFKATRVHERVEFLASKEVWFRPVFLAGGPDGCLYVVDMYRELIEGATFMPDELVKQLDPSAGVDRGRVYRVAPEDFKRPKAPRLSRASTAELVAMLASPDGWHRDTASRLLYERRDRAAIAPLRNLAASASSARARLHALYSLAAHGALTPAEVVRALHDPQPELRENAAILAERFAGDDDVLKAMASLCDDPEVRVRCQAAYSLGYFPQPRATKLLVRLAERDGTDPWVGLGILCSSAGRAGALFAALAEQSSGRASAGIGAILGRLTEQIVAAKQAEDIARVIDVVNGLPATDNDVGSMVIARLMASPSAGTAAPPLSGRSALLWRQVVAVAKRTASDEKATERNRVAAVATLALTPLGEARETFQQLLEPRQSEAVQLAVVKHLARYREPEVAELLLGLWPSLSPRVRSSAVEILLSRASWATAMLEAVLGQRLARAEIDGERRQRLQLFPDAGVRQLAQRILTDEPTSMPAEVVARYRDALHLAGDVARGRETFRKNCSSCHELEGFGKRLGADLHAVGDRGADAVLLNILDPNREVKPNYLVYIVSTADGQILTGLVSGETPTSLAITQADGTSKTVLRSEIEEMRNTGRSFMPQGLEKEISVPEMADLLAYLLARK
jgi:putative membrane-bound dehydrogenase-like protein